MRHPLLKSHDEVRKRMIALLTDGLMVRRSGNLIFVCGGNESHHLRPQFRAIAEKELSEFQIFQPEFAMKNYFSDAGGAQLDLGEFEVLVGDLSHAVVLFPEAPGSFAETGYFANIEKIAQKVILALDLERQSNDSFIMMGPARKYEQYSRYSPNIQIDYTNPNFDSIVKRISRIESPKTRKILDVSDISDHYDLFCLIYKIFDILIVATFEDLIFVLHSLTGGHAPKKRARELASILVGADYLKSIGQFGHYYPGLKDDSFVKMRTGFAEKESTLKLEILDILNRAEPEFGELVKGRHRAS